MTTTKEAPGDRSGVCQMNKCHLCPAVPGAVEGYLCGCSCHVLPKPREKR